MKRKIAIATGIVASFLVCFGVANAIQTFDDAIAVPSLHVGSQGLGGATFFNGTITNNTTDDDGDGLPVTFGDDVRIDGAIQRGNNSDADVWPVKVNDDLTVYGSIDADSITWDAKYSAYSISPFDFTNLPDDVTIEETENDGYMLVNNSGANVTLYAPAHLPNQSIVNYQDSGTISFFWYDGVAEDIASTIYLMKQDNAQTGRTTSIPENTAEAIACWDYYGSCGDLDEDHLINNNTNIYFVKLVLKDTLNSDEGAGFVGGLISYYTTQP